MCSQSYIFTEVAVALKKKLGAASVRPSTSEIKRLQKP